jgi:CDP-glycerol glycerophosphotransferase (TagB/SpsB family)
LNAFNKNDEVFDPLLINSKYLFNMTQKNKERYLKLQKSYAHLPKFVLKKDLLINDNEWSFENLFNEYFCFCKDLNSIKLKNSQSCKYYFYLNLIDKNRKIYSKNDYLFIDFIFNDLSSDDAFPIFKEMFREKLPVHYLTESSDIYNQYCSQIYKCQTVLLVNKLNYTINGDFLEKYLTLLLKLKQVISGSGTYFNYINNLFYNVEYITLISVTHGVCYFKYFLYDENRCYGSKRIDKVLIPPSEKILSFAIKYGWNSKDIIKLNLPKWDKYNKRNNLNNMIYNNNCSILIMFTWREVIKNKQISSLYFQNIFNLIFHKELNKELKKYNITLYFALHHKIYTIYKYKIENMKYIQYIEVNNIADYIEKSNLFITDFSSIIFDFIYQRKPFIIYIPDSNDILINIIYKKNYYELIQSMKNETIEFENIIFNIDSVINKILYYIKNNFRLDENLKIFYDSLNLTQNNNIYEFIKYIKNIN